MSVSRTALDRAVATMQGLTYAEVLEQVLGLAVDVQLAVLRVLGEVQGGDLGDVLVLALTLLLLKLEGDATDGATLNTLHQVGGVASNLRKKKSQSAIPSYNSLARRFSSKPGLERLCASRANLVAEALGGNDGNLIADALVGLEVEGQAGVVPLDDDLGGLLDGLGTNATHFGGIGLVVVGGRWVVEQSLVRSSRPGKLVVCTVVGN